MLRISRYILILCVPTLMSLLMLITLAIKTSPKTNDLLAYIADGSLMLYDPDYRLSTGIINSNIGGFEFSIDGHIAYSQVYQNDVEIFVLDIHALNRAPINVTNNPTMTDSPRAWSRDGRYLAYVSYQDRNDDQQLYIWDQETGISLNITPENMGATARNYQLAWSYDGRLAMTIFYTASNLDAESPSEIYIWDGNTTFNLSQSLIDHDYAPAWHTDGQLAFSSRRDDETPSILIWDGTSFKNNLPDADTFTRIVPELTLYYFARWTTDGLISISGESSNDTHQQIYLLDGGTTTNVSQNPTLHNGGQTWSSNGNWAFVTFFSSQQSIYVRDADNNTLLSTDGQSIPAWNASGDLVFCHRDSSGWGLSVWDGNDVHIIKRGWEIYAQWQGGTSSVVCSSG